MNVVFQSFREHSLFWLMVSGVVGAVIGAAIKFLFDDVLTPRYAEARESLRTLRKYSYPLLRAAEALDARLYNFIEQSEPNWLADDYYRVTTLYLIGCYFGWCRSLESDAFLDYVSDRAVQRFNILYSRVFKGLSSFYYFSDLALNQADSEAATVPRLALTAIGELMNGPDDRSAKNGGVPLPLVDFRDKLQASKDFQHWFSFIETLLKDTKRGSNNPRWNRLLIFAVNLRVFLAFLDRKGRYAASRNIPYLGRMHPNVAARVRIEVEEGGYGALLQNATAPSALGLWPGDRELNEYLASHKSQLRR